MFKITVNDTKTFEIDLLPDKILSNGQIFDWDCVEISPNVFHILKNNRSYTVEILKSDTLTKTFQLKINNGIYNLSAEDELDLLLEKMGLTKTVSNQVTPLKAPMPGLVLDVKVIENQEVKKGDTLVILEAMKMENILKAPADGIVKSLKVKKGDRVEKNQVLINF